MEDLLRLFSLEYFVVVSLFFCHVLFAKLSAHSLNFWSFGDFLFHVLLSGRIFTIVFWAFFLFVNLSLLIVNMSINVDFAPLKIREQDEEEKDIL